MKAIILISSIFYILGLKIGNKIDLVKKSNPVDKIITNSITTVKPSKSISFKDASGIKAESDSLKGDRNIDKLLEKSK